MTFNVSRRSVVGILGAAVATVPLVAAVGGAEPRASVAPPAQGSLGIEAGTRVARWTVVRVEPLREGAVVVAVRGEAAGDHEFLIEILARDASTLASRPPAETARFALYVKNGGDGWSPTLEEQGLAAMTLASVLRTQEAAISTEGFLTHSERIRRHPGSLLRTRLA